MRIAPKISSAWPILAIIFLVLIFFYPVWLRGHVPIPADITVGLYYPWLDYKWGYEVGVPVKNPIISDVVSVIYPLRSLAVDLVKNGELPLWNSLMFAGYPLFANFQVALLSPTMIFFLFLPKVWAWTAQVMVQPLFAMGFSYLFLRHLKLSKLASVLGGLIYAFSGFNVIWLEWNAHALVAAWIPLILLLVDKFLLERRQIWGVFLAASLALQIFSGYPQLVAYTLLATGLLVVFRLKALSISSLFKLTLFLVLGVLLSAIQTIPAFELFLQSQRIGERLTPELVYLPWQNLISLFAPDYFGNHATGNFWGVGNYTLNIGYTGVVAFILSLVAIFSSWKKTEVKFFAVLFLISLLLTLPTPISTFVFRVGLFGGQAASTTRILVLANLSLAFLAAFGIETIRQFKWNWRIIRLTYSFWIVLVGVGLGTVLGRFWIGTFRTQFLDSVEALKIIDYWLEVLRVGLRNLILPVALLLTTTIFLVLCRWKFLKNVLSLGFLFLLIFELFRFGHKYLTFSRQDLVFPKTPVIEFLIAKYKEEGPFRVLGGDVVPMNMLAPYGLETASGYDAFYPLSYAKFLAKVNREDENQPRGRYGDIQKFDSNLLDLANVRYILGLKRDKIASPDPNGKPSFLFDLEKLKPVFQDGTVVVLENKNAFPRVFLEVDGKRQDVKISYSEYNPLSSKLTVNAPVSGTLVVSEQYYPGWKVLLDGKEAQIISKYDVFRGVTLPRGIHAVEFIYEPESFKIGAKISFATAVFLVALVLYEKFTTNKSRKIA